MRFYSEGDVEHQLEMLLNNGLTLIDNHDGAVLEIESTGAQQEVQHGLGYVPTGFIVLLKDMDMRIWAENLSSWTSETLFLNTSAANAVVRLFVL